MIYETVHLHKSKIQNSSNIHLLFIPTVIFVLIIAVYFFASYNNKTKIAATSGSSVLGEEKQLDIPKNIPQNEIR